MSHEGTAPTAPEPQDRKAMLLEQFNEIEAATPDAPAPAPTPAAPTPAQPAATPGPARDEHGKFAAKDKAAPVAAAVDPAAAQPVVPEAPQPWARAPRSWKKEHAEGWAALPPAYQQYVHEREQQMKASVDPLIPKAELADRITKVAEPYMNTIRGLGVDLPDAVGSLMRFDHELRTQPLHMKVQLLGALAQRYGVDLSGQLQQAQQTQGYHPLVEQLQNKVLEIEGRFSNLTQQQEAERDRAALQEIQSFRETAEHFEEVRPTMVSLLQGGIAVGIKDAYDKALRLHPDLYDSIQSARQATADAEKRKAADTAAKLAKAAAVSVKSATPGTATPTKAQDRRSMLREQLDGLSERL